MTNNTLTITTRTGYQTALRAIELAVAEVVADQPDLEGREDEVFTDLAESILIDASEEVGREVCRYQLGFVPQSLANHWAKRRAADAVTASQREAARKQQARERAEQAKITRGRRVRAEQEEARRNIVASLCPRCFTVPAASGNCNC